MACLEIGFCFQLGDEFGGFAGPGVLARNRSSPRAVSRKVAEFREDAKQLSDISNYFRISDRNIQEEYEYG